MLIASFSLYQQLFNNLPESVRDTCPTGTICETLSMKQHIPTNTHFPWAKGSSVLCEHELEVML